MDQFGLVSVISAFSLDQFGLVSVIAGGRTARKERSRGRVVAEAPSCARSSRLSFQCLDAKHENTLCKPSGGTGSVWFWVENAGSLV